MFGCLKLVMLLNVGMLQKTGLENYIYRCYYGQK